MQAQRTPHSFDALLRSSLKSTDTEEWLDVHFTRKVGLLIALGAKRMHLTPNIVTLISIVLGIGAAVMFFFSDVWHNIIGIALLMVANFCDSADGQLARLTNQKSKLGRILDGVAGDVWFVSIYIALCLRMTIGAVTEEQWLMVVGVWVLGAVAGLVCHSVQSAQADYYRQLHLLMLHGENEAALWPQSAGGERSREEGHTPWYERLFNTAYQHYSAAQQHRAPQCVKMLRHMADNYNSIEDIPPHIRKAFLYGSRPLMKYTNILTFNTRAIILYIACLLNIPWAYFLAEILLLQPLYFYMRHKHERLCQRTMAQQSLPTEP